MIERQRGCPSSWPAKLGLALWLLGLAGGTNGYNASKSETDKALEETKQTIESGRELIEKHREEVREIEEEDFSGVPIGDLIDGANERERRRTDRTEP